ncbi:MAG: peptide/nickel transport system permease protein [Actinomycetota bacterium]|jgi:peptide/nickel transport system permease protein|nr:peptide/nickel transport system permease protein [Actinomycetota bacterium]MEA2446637.1 peptide/nickel transport system permease protein [Actinomycetota bacterium]
MGRYIVRRLLYVFLVVLVITLATFLIFFVMPPGDPVTAFSGRTPTPQILHAVEKQFGFDKPLYVQYGKFVKNIFFGDEFGWPGFGYSYVTRSPVREEIFGRIGVTLQLAVGAAIMWVIVGVSIGIVSALNRRKLVDRAAMGFALFGVSAPTFAVGLAALYIFWQQFHLLPGTGYIPLSENAGEFFSHMILPWSVLALSFAAFYARMVRGNLLEALGEDYIRTARAKGLSEKKVIGKHGLRASLTPIVTIFGLDFSLLLGGAVLTERVFNLPGLGALVVQSVARSDLPVILATTVIASLFVTVMTLVVDIIYGFLDPRVRYT